MKIFARVLTFFLAASVLLAGCGAVPEGEKEMGGQENVMVSMYIPYGFIKADSDGNVMEETVLLCDKSGIKNGKLVFTPESSYQGLVYEEVKEGVRTVCYGDACLTYTYDSYGRCISTVTEYTSDLSLSRRENLTEFDAQGLMKKITVLIQYPDGDSHEYQYDFNKEITSQGILLYYGDETIRAEYLCNEDGQILETRGYRNGIIVQRVVNTFDECENVTKQDIYYSENGKDEAVFQYTVRNLFEVIRVTEEVAAFYPMFRTSN